MDTNNKIKKCIKSYLCGIKHKLSDKNKAIDYFNKTLLILTDIIPSNDSSLIKESVSIDDNKKELLSEIYNKSSKYILKLKGNLFDLIDKGNINNIKKYYNEEDFYVYNNEGITPLHYAIRCGDTLFLKYAFSLGVSIDTPDKRNGHTLLEYACLIGDPNMIDFLILNGANIKKHHEFRSNIKFYNQNNQIDYSLIMKYIIVNNSKESNIKALNFVLDYISPTEKIGLDNIEIKEFLMYIEDFLLKISVISKQSYIDILKDEVKYNLLNNIYCPNNKLEIILYNLVPFIIDYPFNLSLKWLVNLELKYIYNKDNIKENIKEIINKQYIETELFTNNFIHNLLTHMRI
jgi:hypothetical protein